MARTSPARVLVVENDPAALAALGQILQAQHCEVCGVDSGDAALAELRAAADEEHRRFDILILALEKAAPDGMDLLRAAEQVDVDLVCIVASAGAPGGYASASLSGGALEYILKPFEPDSVVPVLARAQAMRRLRLDNRALAAQVSQGSQQLETLSQQLTRSNQALESFIQSVSHDLRQPLNGVIGFSDLLISGKPGPLTGVQKQYLQEIVESGNRLLHLLEALRARYRPGQ